MPLQSPPSTRTQFKEYCLRRLGKGVIDINVSDEQVSDRINDALLYWWDWGLDGTEHAYFSYQVTPTDIQNQYITLPENIIGAVQIFDIGNALNTENMFDI